MKAADKDHELISPRRTLSTDIICHTKEVVSALKIVLIHQWLVALRSKNETAFFLILDTLCDIKVSYKKVCTLVELLRFKNITLMFYFFFLSNQIASQDLVVG